VAAKDPTQVAQKWAQNLGNATQHIQAGVAAVTQAPGQKAAAQKALWLSQIQANADKWARNVSAVPLSAWQDAMTTKGINRIASGAQAAIPKMTNFLTQFLPYVEQGRQQVASMPKGGMGNSEARMVAMMRHNAAFSRRPAGA
jgi:hypothetical protein